VVTGLTAPAGAMLPAVRHLFGIPVWCTGRLLLLAAKERSKCSVKEQWEHIFQHLAGFALELVMYERLHPTKSNSTEL